MKKLKNVKVKKAITRQVVLLPGEVLTLPGPNKTAYVIQHSFKKPGVVTFSVLSFK